MACEIEHRTRTLTTKVDESTYARVLELCTDKTASEWLRDLIEWRLGSQPDTVTLLAELLAFRRLFVRSFLVPEADMTVHANALRLIAETDATKVQKAQARLGLAQPAEGVPA